ncbi:hypothetical protein [Micromonospora eburnea]|uniref:Uncharacterized protein n=1 Tax=Micromonospora eburnea TaxID=227316 RepID=A0A1C6UI68_9ACTN|nr:hypothetical protein [Micromonospora eburnea]SCL53654.1 hypothetical protein GA0070604_2826 [Micromonospora eburnea]
MTDVSGGRANPPGRRPRWMDRGREQVRRAGPRLMAVARTLWGHLLPAWRRLQAAAEGEVLSPPPDEVVEHRERAGPITVAAKGHVFTFSVRAVLTWSATGLRTETLTWYARYFLPAVIQRLRRAAADRARDLPPHRAGDLEVALQAALAAEGPWRYAHGGVSVECRPEVWVRHDERVQQALRPYWERMIELECQYELYLKRARYAEELNRRWVTIAKEFVDDPAGGEEARTISEELARARRHMAAERQAAARWSADLMRDRDRQEGIFEPFTAIDIVPQQASGSAQQADRAAQKTDRAAQQPTEAAGPTRKPPGRARDAAGRPAEAPRAEGGVPQPGPEDRR